MQHTEKHFWSYAGAYLLLGAGTFLIVAELAEWAFVGKQVSLVAALVAIWIGFMAITRLNQTTKKSPTLDATEHENDVS